MFASHLRRATISVEPVTVKRASLAREAFSDYGKGSHDAGLNFGFSYVLAKATAKPLLFKVDDFRKTDVIPRCPKTFSLHGSDCFFALRGLFFACASSIINSCRPSSSRPSAPSS